MEFRWIPATEPDPQAIEQMLNHFPKPSSPMLNPWTIGGLHYHTLAFEEPIQTLEIDLLIKLLDDISAGIATIGFYNDYKEWFLYTLPFALPRCHEGKLEPVLTNLITALFNIYRDGLVEEYEGFRQDILNTLAVAIMQPAFWYKDNDFQIEGWEITSPAYNFQASKTLSAAMLLCLKILKRSEMTAWAASLLTIAGPKWKVQLMKCLVNADKFFEVKFGPGKPISDYLSDNGLGWHADAYLFRPNTSLDEFVPKAIFELFRSEIFRHLTPTAFLEWVEEISSDPVLKEEFSITGLPDIFFDHFYN